MIQVCEARREKLRLLMDKKGIDALFISHEANRYYLSSFELHDGQKNEYAGYLLITKDGRDWLFTDPRYWDAAKRLWDPSCIFIYGANAANAINEHIKKLGYMTVGFEARTIPYAFQKSLVDGFQCVEGDGLVEELRMIKDEHEIACLREACALNHKLMQWVPSVCLPGRTERAVAWDIEKFFRENGASELAFSSIVAVGPNAALPHAIPGDTVITEDSPVLIDVGCRLNDYCSDQTRTIWVGSNPTDEFKRTMEFVRKAQDVAIASMEPGMPVKEAHAVAVKVFKDVGVEEFFTHSLGHGIGLETHEAPSVNSRSDAVLKPGMVVTAEPGLYYPEWGGIRWEHMVLVTENGVERM
ncbi:M24 family metallopeptidase [Halodesulfovibrio marinisediminis]|uniref:Xaa-Pro aminopeptidase n=1 Tax=Halodesulfovibrio marinisediminis DSM 17456 TaxID=1121457 RepID=A0A1N6F2N0_9BACT|nr:aminopeptidase P family protein [Halodesulfovibrio marinisediminis]SIN89476.1 Xaa-Pro aminopeptidase [Halodesulfovibrio marinisediminis DSM 17456]